MPTSHSYATSTPNSRRLFLSAFGETKTVTEWSRDERCPISAPAIRKRLKAGWDPVKAISTPVSSRVLKRTTPDGRVKPRKPYKAFPLYAHNNGKWAKRIRGTLYYFGPWDDPDSALKRYQDERDDLYAGRKPRAHGDGHTIRDLCNCFLTDQELKVASGEITRRSFNDYHRTCGEILKFFQPNRLVDDLGPDDFSELRAHFNKGRKLTTVSNEIGRARVVFNYAMANDITTRLIKFGSVFKKPTKKSLRRIRKADGEKMYSSAEINAMLDAAAPQLKAMVLLAINCGFGNHDCGRLPKSAVNLNTGWIKFPRPKTGIDRRCPLWPETAAAIEAALATRPQPQDPAHNGLVFMTKRGQPWTLDRSANPISAEFRKLVKQLGIHKNGWGFYLLRHTFATRGGDCCDQVAVDFIMGRVDDSTSAKYRETVFSERLHNVVNYVHSWLFGSKGHKSN